MDGDCTPSVIRQIADTLGISEDAFFANPAFYEDSLVVNPLLEQSELLKMFHLIENNELRRSCLRFVREAAAMSEVSQK